MNKSTINLALVVVGTFLFDFLFFEEKLGINTALFALFYVAGLAWLFPESRFSRPFWATAVGTLIAAAMVGWHNSTASKLAFCVAAITAAGFAQATGLRFVLSAVGQYFGGLAGPPGRLFNSLYQAKEGEKKRPGFRKLLSLSLLPILVAAVFYFLYYVANDNFARLSDEFWRQVGRLISFDIRLEHVLFVLLGFFLVGAAFWKKESWLEKSEPLKSDSLKRIRPPKPKGLIFEKPAMLGLQREHRQSLILLGLLNVLLLVVNLTDFRYVWFGFDDAAARDLKSYVHEGTYFLIASILLAMAVLGFVFRKNLNFLSTNSLLKKLALVWLIQNGILASSVAVRTIRYIDFHGLAYKRIGVFLFLLLVLFGLRTLWLKIRDCRSRFWLFWQNGWAVFALLIANSLVPWDTFITRYNLFTETKKQTIDINFLLYQVSDKNLFLLEENLELLKTKKVWPEKTPEIIEQEVQQKRAEFDLKQSRLTWKSWNAADARNRK